MKKAIFSLMLVMFIVSVQAQDVTFLSYEVVMKDVPSNYSSENDAYLTVLNTEEMTFYIRVNHPKGGSYVPKNYEIKDLQFEKFGAIVRLFRVEVQIGEQTFIWNKSQSQIGNRGLYSTMNKNFILFVVTEDVKVTPINFGG